jgi:hypothetical protein
METIAFLRFYAIRQTPSNVSVHGFLARDGAALIRRRDKGALYPLDTAFIRPLSTFPDTQNAPSVEQARLRRLLASSRDGRFSVWSPMKSVFRHTQNGLQTHLNGRHRHRIGSTHQNLRDSRPRRPIAN